MPSRTRWRVTGGLCVVVALAAGTGRFAASEPPANPAPDAKAAAPSAFDRDAASRAVREKLQTKVAIAYEDFPLENAIEDLAKRAEVRYWIDRNSLENEGVAIDSPVTGRLEGVTVETALDVLLPELGLDWYIRDGVLTICMQSTAADILVTRTYEVGPLLAAIDDAIKKRPPPDDLGYRHLPPEVRRAIQSSPYPLPSGPAGPEAELIDAIEHETAGPWIAIDGVGGSISPFENLLVIRQTRRNHDDIAALIAALKSATAAEPGPRSYVARPATYPLEADEALRAAFDRRVTGEYDEAPLDAVLTHLFEQAGLPHRIDKVALQNDGIALDSPVTLRQKDIPLRSALRLIFQPLGLTYIPDHGMALVTTEALALDMLHTVVYDVRDLVRDADFTALIDVIENESSGPWLSIDGIGGSVTQQSHGLLVIGQTTQVHEEIEEILDGIRRDLAKPKAKEPPPDPDSVETTIYHIADPGDDPQQFVATIRKFVAPESWEGPRSGEATLIGHALIVRHRNEIQKRVADFVERLNAAAPGTTTIPPFSSDFGSTPPAGNSRRPISSRSPW